MAGGTELEELRAEIARLNAENAQLRTESTAPIVDAPPAKTRRKGLWRGISSAAIIVIATLLVPVSIVSAWTRTELVSEEAFVDTFGPLADDPAIQALVTDQVSDVIIESVDVDSLTNSLFDGIATLDLPPTALSAIELLRTPAAEGVRSLIHTGVSTAVESEAFPAVWDTALRTTHRALVATATGQTGGAITIDDTGEVALQLGPIIEAVTEQLEASGFGFAANIPVINATFVIAQSDVLPLISVIYGLAVAVGWWTPLVALLLFAAGIAIARSRRTAIMGTGIGFAIGSYALAIALTVGGTVAALQATSLQISTEAVESAYQQIVGDMVDTSLVMGLLGLIIILLAWITGPSKSAGAIQRVVDNTNAAARSTLAARGVRTGGFGLAMYRYRMVWRIAIPVVAVLILLALRPLSFGDVIWTIVIALIVWWIAEILQTVPVAEEPVIATAEEDAPTSSDEEPTPVA